ncbi:hypothetical protein [Aurantimonas marina]|uniref:hypothetical protein n=1 Tax=Aurantimonas marina TaxID=2780508 RepID=UPI0019D05609|nr:hypothetical protein [Aurantimonas marina]
MLYLDDATRRRLRGTQDGWLKRLGARQPTPKPKPRKINRDRRRRLVENTIEILKTGQPTPFTYEAACRHGLRSAFCSDGWTWRDADATALDIVATALRFIGAKRPTWMEGQPEHTQEGFSPIERTRCVRCGGNMPDDDLQNGWERRYCSNMCRSSDRLKWERVSGERRTQAEYWAAMAVTGEAKKLQRERPCQWCGTPFIPRNIVDDIAHCSRSCAAKTKGAQRKIMKPCEACGELYHASGPGAGKRFCSQACWNSVYLIQPKPCEWCGTEFTPKSRRVRFCSSRCSARHRCAPPAT